MAESKEERRRQSRKKGRAPLILIDHGPKKLHHGAVMRDASHGGLAFESLVKMEPGDIIRFAIFIARRGWAVGVGRVRWIRPNDAGLGWLCGASITIEKWEEAEAYERWLEPDQVGWFRAFFFPGS